MNHMSDTDISVIRWWVSLSNKHNSISHSSTASTLVLQKYKSLIISSPALVLVQDNVILYTFDAYATKIYNQLVNSYL